MPGAFQRRKFDSDIPKGRPGNKQARELVLICLGMLKSIQGWFDPDNPACGRNLIERLHVGRF